ncbi:MAG: urease accessory protein [Acidobacteriota bacterium]|nr:urease accessory protein [Acidobacteriota bacterium]
MSEILLFSTISAAAILGGGFLLGLRHATDADHLAAVSTIVSERRSLLGSAVIGGIWGLGHTISLLVAGVVVLLLDFRIGEQNERMLEFFVGVMLVLLGLNALRKILQGGKIHFHAHEHGMRQHVHPHLHEPGVKDETNTHHGFSFSPRALIIGMVHGLAGSAALMLAIIPTIDSRPLGLLYIAIFGIGSIGGMMLMSLLIGLPYALTALRFNRFNYILQSVAGLISVGLGLFIIYEKAVTEGLFS